MTGPELIAVALAAAMTDTSSGAIRGADTGLREALRRRLAGRGHRAVQTFDAHTEPGGWRACLGEHLAAAGADWDEQILAAADTLLAHLHPTGEGAGKSAVDLREAKGVQ